MHSVAVKVTSQPADVRTRIPNSEATDSSGTMCPVRVVGRPSIATSHICVDVTIRPSARATRKGRVVGRRLTTGVPSMTKICVAPESAIDIPGGSVTAPPATSVVLLCSWARHATWRVTFDAGTVMSSSSMSYVTFEKQLLAGSDEYETKNGAKHLNATALFAAPNRHMAFIRAFICVLCLPLVEQGWPKSMYCGAFCLVKLTS